MHYTWIRSHVEICLMDHWNNTHRVASDDGNYGFRFKTAACSVGVEKDPPHLVRVVAVAASDVPRSSKLLVELNDVNMRSPTALAYWANRTVLVEHTLHPTAVNAASLAHSCESVGRVAADIGGLVAAVYGGHTPFNASIEADEDAE